MRNWIGGTARVMWFICALGCAVPQLARAEIIDDVAFKTDANGEVNAVIRFTAPIRNLRYAQPPQPATFLVVYFNILSSNPNDILPEDFESHRSPPSAIAPEFSVVARDLNLSPKLEIQFVRPAQFSLKAGRDGRSLILHIKPDIKKPDTQPQPVIAPPAVLVEPAAVLAATAIATPDVSAGNASEAALQTETAPLPVPVLVAPPTVKKNVALSKKVAGQLGGKDGLPAFPKIDEVEEVAGDDTPGVGLSLAEQIQRANRLSAALMVKGRDAILAGDMFAAIDAFNNVLKLPGNQYTPDAQIWIGIAREKSGQPYKARSEYETYLKLYPSGTAAVWAKDRIAKLNAVLPALPTQQNAVARTQSTAFQNMEYGSLSMYYYNGVSHINTQPVPLTRTDQSTLLSNVMMTDRFYNNEFDNRLVFQGFSARNFLPQQASTEQLNAFYMDVRNRIDDYSLRVGRQSPYGGGVMGRFDGATAGYGITSDARVNVVAGQLSDTIIGPKPVFFGASVDLGLKETFGGSVYAIKQTVSGLTDRQAVGGNMRYFEHGSMAMAMLDYDTQFQSVNWATLQGTLHDDAGMDYNFLLDHRRSPVLDLRNAVMGTATSVDVLLQSGFTQSDLLALAKLRTATYNLGMIGMNARIDEKLQAGADFSVSTISGMPQSGTLLNCVQVGTNTCVGGTPGLEGFLPATPSTGAAWTLSGRLIGNDFISNHDISIASLSYTKSQQMTGEMVLFTNHAFLQEQLALDTTLRLYFQTDSFGGTQNVASPVFKLGYQIKNTLTLETEVGFELTKSNPQSLAGTVQPLPYTTTRQYIAVGFRMNF